MKVGRLRRQGSCREANKIKKINFRNYWNINEGWLGVQEHELAWAIYRIMK